VEFHSGAHHTPFAEKFAEYSQKGLGCQHAAVNLYDPNLGQAA
jgi:hypothetical protein